MQQSDRPRAYLMHYSLVQGVHPAGAEVGAAFRLAPACPSSCLASGMAPSNTAPQSLQADQEEAADHVACLVARRCARARSPGSPPFQGCVHPTTVCAPAPCRVVHPRCCRHWQAALAALKADLGEEALGEWLQTDEGADIETVLLEFVTQYLQAGDAEEGSEDGAPQQSGAAPVDERAAAAGDWLRRVVEPAALCIVPTEVGVGSPRTRRLAAVQLARGGGLCSIVLKLLRFDLLRCAPSLPRPQPPERGVQAVAPPH